MSQAKEAQIKLYKTHEDKELDKVIALENKVKVLNDIVYKTGQSVQTMNMLNRNCKMSFAKPEFLKKAQRANPRLYDIGCYNDNLALMLAPDSDETIRVIPNTRVSRPRLKSNQLEDRVMSNNSQGKKQEVEDHRRKCVLNDNHDLCVLHYINGVNSRTRQPMAVPISTREPKHNVNQSVATFSKKTVATDSTVKKSRNITRKLYEQGNDRLKGSRGTDLYSITLQDLTTPNPICLMVKATSSQAWLWHRNCCYYSRYSWNHFFEVPKTTGVLIDFLTLVQRGLHAQVTTVQTNKGTKFLNKTLHAYFAKEGIRYKTSTARTPEQNGIVERRNRTLVEAARIMLSATKVPLFFWAEAIATSYGENLDKMKEKGDACIFVGYSTQSKAYRVFNKRTRMIVETIHVNFDELPQMASDHVSSDPGPQCSTTVLEQESLSPDPQSQENVSQAAETETTSNELELLYSPMFSELLNGNSPVVSKSSAVHAADNPDKRQQHNTTHTSTTTDVADPPPLNIQSTHQTPTQVPTVTAPENIIQAETNTENA
ncbi:retrovirus-related pol polyprotein from transposon TNT 1-94 [Tanacetum coccineum]